MGVVVENRSSPFLVLLSGFALGVACLTFGAIGPTFLYLQEAGNVLPLMCALWRNQICIMCFIPLAMIEIRRTPQQERRKWFKSPQNSFADPASARWTRRYRVTWSVVVAGLAWAAALGLWVSALPLTTTVRASLLESCYPFLIVIYSCCRGIKISRWEAAFMVVCAAGLVLSELQPLLQNESPTHTTPTRMLIGDAMCFLAAVGNAVNVLSASEARQTVPAAVFSLLVTLVSTAALIPAALLEAGTLPNPRIWERDGVVGWVMLPEPIIYYFVAFGFVVGVVGLLSWNFAVGHIHPLVSSSARLTDPAITGIISFLLGLEGVPGLFTFVGGLTVLAGLAGLTVAKHKRAHAMAVAGESFHVSVSKAIGGNYASFTDGIDITIVDDAPAAKCVADAR